MLRQVWNLCCLGSNACTGYAMLSFFWPDSGVLRRSQSMDPAHTSAHQVAPRIITAISDFVIMYTTELWVFTGGLTRRGGHAPCCSLLRGYFICLRLLAWICHSFSSGLSKRSLQVILDDAVQVIISSVHQATTVSADPTLFALIMLDEIWLQGSR